MDDRITAAQFQAVKSLTSLLDDFGGGVIIGGVAVSLLANPRFTKDVDGMLLLDSADIPRFLNSAADHHLMPRFSGMEDYAKQARLAVLQHLPTGVTVDIALGSTPFEEQTLERAKQYSHDDFSIRLPSPEDLIIMKGIAHREQDMADIRAIAEVYPNLDRIRVERWLRDYADLLDSPDIWDDVDRLLKRVLPPLS